MIVERLSSGRGRIGGRRGVVVDRWTQLGVRLVELDEDLLDAVARAVERIADEAEHVVNTARIPGKVQS